MIEINEQRPSLMQNPLCTDFSGLSVKKKTEEKPQKQVFEMKEPGLQRVQSRPMLPT